MEGQITANIVDQVRKAEGGVSVITCHIYCAKISVVLSRGSMALVCALRRRQREATGAAKKIQGRSKEHDTFRGILLAIAPEARGGNVLI